MKVILAGYSKTGTKTLSYALTLLGYKVFDFMEHFWYHGKDWNRILISGGSVEDFKRMYEDVDAITDAPVFFFWEQIHQAFPDALIILTTRDEEAWFESWKNQFKTFNRKFHLQIMWALSPMGWAFHRFFANCHMALFGFCVPHVWSKASVNRLAMLNRFRMHNQYVLNNAPKDKLLVLNVRDGWEPLCKFLGKDVPDVPFPHKNVGGSIHELLLKENVIMQRLNRDTKLAALFWLFIGTGAVIFIRRKIFV